MIRVTQGKLCQPSRIIKRRVDDCVPAYVTQWIKDNTTPSSNSRNVVNYRGDGMLMHYIIAPITKLHTRRATHPTCHTLAHSVTPDHVWSMQTGGGEEIQCRLWETYFLSLVPKFVRLKKVQDGLCPRHYTSLELHKEFVKKRARWHKNCTCACRFCRAVDISIYNLVIFFFWKIKGMQPWKNSPEWQVFFLHLS